MDNFIKKNIEIETKRMTRRVEKLSFQVSKDLEGLKLNSLKRKSLLPNEEICVAIPTQIMIPTISPHNSLEQKRIINIELKILIIGLIRLFIVFNPI